MVDFPPLSISAGRLSATVSPLGAELQTLSVGGRNILWTGDPAVWSGRAPILFPIVGRLAGDRYRLDGRSYELPQHGFARRRTFSAAATAASAVTLSLEDSAETMAAWPFAFRLDVTYAIDGVRLDTTAVVHNRGDRPMPLSIGFHPGLAWPLPFGGRRADHAVVFDDPETAPVRRPGADGLLSARSEPSPVDGRRLALSDDLFAGGALVFTDLQSRRLVYGAEGSPRIAVDFPDTPHLGLWTKPGAGAPYVCVEPWQGHADPEGFAGEFRDKPGLVTIPPGMSRRWRMGLELVD